MNLKEALKKYPTFIVSIPECPFCVQAINLLERKMPHEFKVIDRDSDPMLDREITKETNHRTYPKIYVKGKFVGGYDNLSAYVQNKGL